VLANLAAEIESIDLWEHDVEKEERRLIRSSHLHYPSARQKSGHVISGIMKIMLDQLRHIRVVFHDVN
jgi:hypothetical protein